MTKGERVTKQIIVALVFLIVVGGIGYGGYAVFRPPVVTPTPNPTINLAPISVVFSKLIVIGENDYDFVAKISNPNTDYGSPNVEYAITFFDASGNQISQKSDTVYILPGQTKYVIETPLKFSEPVAQVEMKIKSVDWQQLDPLTPANISLLSRNVNYSEVDEPGVFGKIGGSIQNNSNFDFGQVSVLGILFDDAGVPIAVGKTEILTFLTNTSRGFEIAWYSPFVGKVSRTEVEIYTNIFENSNFILQYQKPGKFQQYY